VTPEGKYEREGTQDCVRLPTVLAGMYFVAFACLFFRQAPDILGMGP